MSQLSLYEKMTPQELLTEYMSKYREEYVKAEVKSIVRLFPGSFKGIKILDLGCGGGFYSLVITSMGANDITVQDIEKLFVKATRLNLDIKQNIKVEGVCGDCMRLPFQDEAFDFIICVNVIERIPRDDLLLEEAARVLKRGGLFIVTARNSTSLNNLKQIQCMKMYSPIAFEKKLMRHGFNVRKHSGAYFIPYIRVASIFNAKPRLAQVIKSILKKTNEFLEYRGDRSPINKYGWEHAYLCKKTT
ncbi:MAG: class I SAM-dependent methyltransferase [Candidatus Bathyarchaeota archaeon]|nr:class I SAM-dependent methyltransferase [Candidatus Bathyarchaeota archaeon]